MKCITFQLFVYVCLVICSVQGIIRRCFECRSRGELGSCKDPFSYNVTSIDSERGIASIPCASGWCGKTLEGGSSFKDDDYGIATERMCLQRGPSDDEERCAYTVWKHKKVYACFCQGDLCNHASVKTFSLALPAVLLVIVRWLC